MTATVLISWDDPYGGVLTTEDITDRVRSFATFLGRKGTEGVEPGTAVLVLDNHDRRFDPLFSAGPHYGDLLPGRRVQVVADPTGDTLDQETLWVGYVDGWPQDYSQAKTGDLTVYCTDMLRWVLPRRLPESVWEIEVREDAPWLWWRFTEESGETVEDWSGHGRTGAVSPTGDMSTRDRMRSPVVGDRNSVLSGGVQQPAVRMPASEPAPPLESGFFFTVEFWLHTSALAQMEIVERYVASTRGLFVKAGMRSTSDTGVPAWYPLKSRLGVTSEADSTVGEWEIVSSGNQVNDDRAHHVVVTRKTTGGTVQFYIYVDGVEQPMSRTFTRVGTPDIWQWSAGDLIVGFTGSFPLPSLSIGEFSVYPRAFSQADVDRHHQAAIAPWVGDTTGDRIMRVLLLASDTLPTFSAIDIDTGLSTLGPAILQQATVGELFDQIMAAEQGHMWVEPDGATDTLRFTDRQRRLTDPRSTTVQLTLSDSGTPGTILYETLDLRFDDAEILNDITVTYPGGEALAEDATSIERHGRRARNLSTELAGFDQAYSLAEWLLNRYKNPTPRCREVTVAGTRHTGTATLEAMVGLKVGDRVRIEKTPAGAIPEQITLEVLVEGLGHTFDAGTGDWLTTLHVSAAEAGPWFVWDTAEWDDTTRWAW